MKNIDIMKCKLVREATQEYHSISSAVDAYKVLKQFLCDDAEEKFCIICLNSKGDIVGLHEVSHGCINYTVVHPRDVFKRALLNNANSIIIGHNHPSGDPTPSSEDIEITERLKEVGKLLGVKVLDHIVVGEEDYYSFSNNDRI